MDILVGVKDQKASHKPKPVSVICPTQQMLARFSTYDVEAFEYLCEYVGSKVCKNIKICSLCASVILEDKPVKECNRLLQLGSFVMKKTPLTTPCGAALALLKTSEALFSLNRDAVLKNHARITAVKAAVPKAVEMGILDCHSVTNKLVHCFLHTRVHLVLNKLNE